MATESDLSTAASALRRAEAQRAPIAPLSSTYASLTAEDAYAIQRENIARRLDDGARIKGHKVGLTSRAMQEALGVDEPDYGHLLDDMFVPEDGRIDAAWLCYPRVEIEVAFVLGQPLEAPGTTVADVLLATEFLLPSIEIIDSRIRDWKIQLVDTIADNASASRVVLGGRPVRPLDVDLRRAGATLHVNGELRESGTTAAVLGNPTTAVAWLANRLADHGVRLEAGQVVMPGACTRAVDVGPGDLATADFEGIGPVSVSFG